MTNRAPVVKFLLFAVVTTMLTALLARTIQGHQDHHGRTFSALFTDATRLQPGDDVRLAGVTVGRVDSVGLSGESAKVRFTLDRAVPLTTQSTLAIRYRNLIGERYLALDVPAGGRPQPSDEIVPTSRTRAALDLTAVFNGFRPLFQGLDSDAINSLSMSLVQALQGEGGTLASLLSGTGDLGRTVSAHDAAIGRLVTDLTTVLEQVDLHSASFNRLIIQLTRFTHGLSGDRNRVVDALAAIDRLSRATDALLTQAEPGIKQTVAGLGAVSARLDGGSKELSQKLGLLPIKLNAILRAAQYGSWFQFYSCGMGLRVDLPNGRSVETPASPPTSEICGG